LKWSPSQINEFINADENMQALYYGSTQIKIENDKEKKKELERKAKKK